MNSSALRIGEVALRAGVSIDTVRYYERRRLLPAAARSEGGFRLFTPDAVERVRFYINSGTYAGQSDSCWSRREKVPLSGITRELIEEALSKSSAVLEARIAGTAGDGGLACATVRLLEGGWKVQNTA